LGEKFEKGKIKVGKYKEKGRKGKINAKIC
jgi:hypothetical protein